MAAAAPAAPLAAAVEAPVLAEGHLHPGVLFLRLVSAIRQLILPLILGLITPDPGMRVVFLVMGGGLFLINMGYALARYLTFQYRLTTEELVTRQGILHRQERRIPVNRIQDLSFEQSLVRRFLGLVVVSVETASGEGAEATMDSLGLQSAANLREALQLQRRKLPPKKAPGSGDEEATGQPPVYAPPAPEEVLFRTTIMDLVLRGLTDNRAGAIFLALFLLVQQADDLGFGDSVFGWFTSLFERLSTTEVVLLTIGVLFVVLLLGWLFSVFTTVLLFFDFALVRRGDVFQRRYGLFTSRVRSLPQRKIQRVLVMQTWLRRIIGMGAVRADSAGSGANDRGERSGGLDIVVPLSHLTVCRYITGFLLPGLQVDRVPWRSVSRKVVQRMTMQGVTLGVLLTVTSSFWAGWWAAFGMLTPLVFYGLGRLLYHNLGYAQVQGHFAMRYGYLGRFRAFIPLRKVQAVILRAGPEDRIFGLARLSVHVAGAGATTLPHLTRADAERLQKDLAEAAAAARFVW